MESNQQLRADQSQVNQQVSHWLKSLTVFLVCVSGSTEDKMRQDVKHLLFYHLFIGLLILVAFVYMYFYMCLCVTACTKKEWRIRLTSVSYQPHDVLLYSCILICAGESRSSQYWSEYNPSTLWVTKLWKQTIPAVSKEENWLLEVWREIRKPFPCLFCCYCYWSAKVRSVPAFQRVSRLLFPPLLIYIIYLTLKSVFWHLLIFIPSLLF